MKVKNIKGTRDLAFWELCGIIILAIALAPITLILLKPLIELKKYCVAKKYTPVQLPEEYRDKVKLIAHRGFRALAPENTLPAFEEAGQAGYWGAENDIHRTKDGVWVLHHDFRSYRMLSKNIKIEKSSYDDILKLNVNNGSNYKDYPNLKVPRLEDYLKKCSEYNMKAFIELKGKNNVEHYDEIVEMVEQYKVDAIFISFEKEVILGMRKVTNAPLFYIVYDIKPEDVEFAKSVENCGIDFDGNDKRNQSQESVDMIHNAGLKSALWAIDDVELVKSFADWGVEYITTNAVYY